MSKINQEIEDMTSEILLNNDMYRVPVNVIKIANANGIKVYAGEIEEKISGAISYIKQEDVFKILVNKNDAKVRQRFTIAHELGHYFLDRDFLKGEEIHVDTTLYRGDIEIDEEAKKREQKVNYFAGALLMNKTLLEKLRNENTIKELADIFEVSVSAMTVRLDILGIL
jgi:hypothetical protein|nr:MAG TPA: IrrE protein [Caudoviricetes sp.]